MEYTENYKLKKPSAEDYYNVEDFNENADIIDTALQVGQNAYNMAYSATNRVSNAETNLKNLQNKAPLRLRLYAMRGTKVKINRSGYNTRSVTFNYTGAMDVDMENIGEWTITYTLNDVTYTKVATVEGPGVVKVALCPDLEGADWAYIDLVGNQGLAEECWSVGDEKTITLGDDSVTVRILDFNHDKIYPYGLGRGKRAAITFGVTEPTKLLAKVHSVSEETLWSERDMHTEYLPNLKLQLASDLQSVIKTVGKVVLKPHVDDRGTGGNLAREGVEIVAEDLFLFSERELFGEARLGNPYYQYEEAYEYYARGANFTFDTEYWLRSLNFYGSFPGTYTLCVNTLGVVADYDMTSSHAIMFGFCV